MKHVICMLMVDCYSPPKKKQSPTKLEFLRIRGHTFSIHGTLNRGDRPELILSRGAAARSHAMGEAAAVSRLI